MGPWQQKDRKTAPSSLAIGEIGSIARPRSNGRSTAARRNMPLPTQALQATFLTGSKLRTLPTSTRQAQRLVVSAQAAEAQEAKPKAPRPSKRIHRIKKSR